MWKLGGFICFYQAPQFYTGYSTIWRRFLPLILEEEKLVNNIKNQINKQVGIYGRECCSLQTAVLLKRKKRKMLKMRFFEQIHKKSVISKNSSVRCFFKSSRWVCNPLYFILIKTALKPLFWLRIMISLSLAHFNQSGYMEKIIQVEQ